jgi:hypothetical protein
VLSAARECIRRGFGECSVCKGDVAADALGETASLIETRVVEPARNMMSAPARSAEANRWRVRAPAVALIGFRVDQPLAPTQWAGPLAPQKKPCSER